MGRDLPVSDPLFGFRRTTSQSSSTNDNGTYLFKRSTIRPGTFKPQKFGNLDFIFITLQHSDSQCVSVQFRDFLVFLLRFHGQFGEQINSFSD